MGKNHASQYANFGSLRICAISFGITFLNITYKDRRNFPPSFTINYINYLNGYVAGFASIMYGLFRIFE